MKVNITREKKSAVIIIPSIGTPALKTSLLSALTQSYLKTKVLVVTDGLQYTSKVNQTLDANFQYRDLGKFDSVVLKNNVGANGFYGHRIYAAFTHLVNEDYIFYLDEDNWLDPNHVESQIENIESNNLDWSYSLRKICDPEGNYIVDDDCESLGKWKSYHGINHIDTNCYCLTRNVAIPVASSWHGGWGQDRVVYKTLATYFPKYGCTGLNTVNYRVDGNAGSVTKEFFITGNEEMRKQYPDNFPWKK
jgi:hypothetical protein